MTKVSFEPYQRITVKSHMKYPSVEAFMDALTLSLARGVGGRGGNLFWANGVVFRHFPYAASASVTKEYLSGHLPIDHIEFAPMPEYRSEVRHGDFIITILDVSNHTALSDLSKWIAESLIRKRPKNKS